MNFERFIVFLSEFMDSSISNIIDMYVRFVEFFKILIFPNLAIIIILFCMGFVGLILFLTLVHYFNKYLAYLTLRYEVETFGKLENPPVLKNDQKSKLKDILFWWDNQCDGWYTTRPKSVDVVLSGEQINLVDVIRIRDATQVSKQGYGVQFKVNSDTQSVFDDLHDALKILEKN